MKLIDVHSHVQFHYFNEDREEVVKRSLEELETFINVGADLEASERAVEDTGKWPIYAAVGFHPEEAEKYSEENLERIEELAQKPKVVAIGEIGLDISTEEIGQKDLGQQIDLLKKQLEITKRVNKPVIFHCRNAYSELFEILKNVDFNVRGLIHCWMGSLEDMRNFISLGLGISFTGNVTYKKNDYIRDSAREVPLDKLFVETDCPFMPPQPIRGSRNEPKFVKMVADCIAEVRGVGLNEIITVTNRNSKELFDLA